ncbi:hypothetical protein HN873_057678 [Arachis hypogaea]
MKAGWTLPEEISFQADFMEAVAELSAASIYFLEAMEAAFSIKFPIFLAPLAVLTRLSISAFDMLSSSSSKRRNSSMALSVIESRLAETGHLKKLSISNSSGRVYMIDFGNLNVPEFLSMRGVQWCWDAICKMLKLASEVKHLFMKVEFTGDFEALQPFPEIDFVEFFNSHPKLRKI